MSQQQLMMHHTGNAATASHHNNYLPHHQMWPTRSYDNGIGIYNHLSATTTTETTTTKPTTTTDYFMDPLNHPYTTTYNYNCGPQTLQQPNTTISFPEHHNTTTELSIPYLTKNKRTYCTAYQRPPQQQSIFISPNNYIELLQQQHQQQQQQPTINKLTRSSSHIGENCNCYTCYALAPLFGAPLPVRPPRSLSQQQLRQHQLLSGSNLTEQWENNIQKQQQQKPITTKSNGLMKWCSESDVSVLDRNIFNTNQNYKNNHNNYHINYDSDLDEHEHIYGRTKNISYNQKNLDTISDYSNFGFGRALAFNAKQQQQQQQNNYDLDIIRNKSKEISINNRNCNSPTLGLRKSLSSESFFEQPTEEGSLYIYGGRQRIQKTPSTTNIYDRVRNLLSNDTTTDNNSIKIVHNNYKKLRNFFDQQDIEDEKYNKKTPKLPPPCWRMKNNQKYQLTHENFKFNNNIKQNTNNNNNNNNNNIKHYDIYKKTKEQFNNNNNNNDHANINKIDNNNNNMTTTATTATTATTTTNTTTTNTKNITTNITIDKKKTIEHHQHNNNNNQQQQQQQYVKQQRNSRSSNCLDISDMESIYGYLKPRKPRSLSLKKIQILDY